MSQGSMEFSKERAADFRRKLVQWFRHHRRNLPWRNTHDPYKIWISEVMLQQTTVSAVIPYYKSWVALFPDVRTLARASPQKVLKAWEGLGYYQRAKNLHRTAMIISHRFEDQFPQEHEILKGLPGIGPYTASALLSFAFKKPYPLVDANVRRVMMRLLRIRHKNQSTVDRTILPFLKLSLPSQNSGHFNQALMELGALICRPKNPLCLLCPISEFCQAYEAGEQEVIPQPKKRHYERIEAVVAIIEKNGRYLIQKRPSRGLLADLWEFPGGKKQRNESNPEALLREVKEELGVEIKDKIFLTSVRHAYTQFQVTLHAFACSLKDAPHLKKDIHRWVALRALHRYPFPSGSAKIIRFLEEREGIRKK